MPAFDIKVEAALGANLAALPSSWVWTDITSYVRSAPGIQVTRGGAAEVSSAFQPTQIRFTLNNSDGRFTVTNPSGPYYGRWGLDTPVRVSINPGTGYVPRGTGFVSKLEHRWPTPRLAVAETDVLADGVLARLEQGRPVRDPLQRAILNSSPLGYWPLTDGTGAQFMASGLSGGKPMSIIGSPSLAAQAGPDGAPDAVLSLTSGGRFTADVPSTTNVTSWAVEVGLRFAAGSNDGTHSPSIVEWSTTGTRNRCGINVSQSPDANETSAYFSTGSATHFLGTSVMVYDSKWHWHRVVATNEGSDLRLRYYIDNVQQTNTLKVGETAGRVTQVRINSSSISTPETDSGAYMPTVASYVVYDTSTAVVDLAAASTGYTGESATTRFTRLCGEMGVQSTVTSAGSDNIATMGAQQSGQNVDLLRQVRDADQGVLSEGVDGRLNYRTRSQTYNQTAALTIDVNQKQLGLPWVPTEDLEMVRNQWTVGRFDGASATYAAGEVDPASPDYDPAVGVRDDEVTVNLANDSDLPYHAQWRVHL